MILPSARCRGFAGFSARAFPLFGFVDRAVVRSPGERSLMSSYKLWIVGKAGSFGGFEMKVDREIVATNARATSIGFVSLGLFISGDSGANRFSTLQL